MFIVYVSYCLILSYCNAIGKKLKLSEVYIITKIKLYNENGVLGLVYKKIVRPLFFKMSAETAHHVMVDGMAVVQKIPGMQGFIHTMYGVEGVPELAQTIWGIPFHSPIGLAAGMDKDAAAVPMFSSMGFGFVEVGTVTPQPQPGNHLPRVFRLPPDCALINRMGFNNKGAASMVNNLQRLKKRRIPVAVNVGKNKNTPNEEAVNDYVECIRQLYAYGDFFVVNISSPNTPDLRKLQHGEELSSLLSSIVNELKKHNDEAGLNKPVLVKIAPDLKEEELKSIVETIMNSGSDGLIATNTTLSREGLTHALASEIGGLSGLPLQQRSTEMIRLAYTFSEGKLPIVGSGGVFSSEDAYEKIRAGASLVEIYTGLVYEGPGINRQLYKGLGELLKRDGFTHISQVIGIDAKL